MIIFHCLINHNYLYVQVSIILGGTYISFEIQVIRFYGYKLTPEFLNALKVYYKSKKDNLVNQFNKHINSILFRNRLSTTVSLL